ncbi:MAG: methionine--tRNA ligase [Candidatus Liptonbacteria bacterium]|nr:methionine--tRNA ligase [Candidatus Liptonbacteria bacterium]
MTIEEFQKVDLRVARILSAERVEGSEKLVRLSVDLGEVSPVDDTHVSDGSDGTYTSYTTHKSNGADTTDVVLAPKTRQILAGIGQAYAPEELVGRQIVVVANLDPRKLMGLESQGMLLAASDASGQPVLLTPEKKVAPGTRIK